jgi:hypothetical protein
VNRTQYLLTKLAEEASEITKDALKAAQFGPFEEYEGVSNITRLQEELFDLLVVIQVLKENKVFLSTSLDPEYVDYKREKIKHYENYARTLGLVSDE